MKPEEEKKLQREEKNQDIRGLWASKFLSNTGIETLITGLSTAECGPAVTTNGH